MKSNHNPLTGVSRQAEWRRRVMRRARSPRARIDMLVPPDIRDQFRAIADAYARETRARRIA